MKSKRSLHSHSPSKKVPPARDRRISPRIGRPPQRSARDPLHSWEVAAQDEERLAAFLTRKLPHLSAKRVKRELESNACLVNGRIERFSSRRLVSGDRVQFSPQLEELGLSGLADQASEVLFEDADLLIVNKAAGMVCDASLIAHYARSLGPLWLVHRLDRETSGALLLARSPEMRAAMETLFRQQLVHKTYWATVDGVPQTDSGRQEQPLMRREVKGGQQRWAAALPGEGLSARTDWRVVSRGHQCAIVECKPVTGRTHQIRVHLALMGHPILGDRQYATRFRCALAPPRPLLHAAHLRFPHPVQGQQVSVWAPPPRDVEQAWEKLAFAPIPRWLSEENRA